MHTKELIAKYRTNDISNSELTALRETLSQLSESELDAYLLESLESDQIDTDNTTRIAVLSIRNRLQRELFYPADTHTLRLSVVQNILRVAAFIMIPLLLASTLYLYREKSLVNETPMVIQTAKGEYVTITLPDGTRVSLNSDSKLTYHPSQFNTRSRSLEFEGEAFFEVVENQKLPFEVYSDKLRLRVLGTTFNYLSYPHLDYIEVKLIEGHVLLSSSLHQNKQTELFANHIARYEKKTGNLVVRKEEGQLIIPWKKRAMVFESANLKEVFEAIERIYCIQLDFDGIELYQHSFTGLLPTDNLDEVITTLEQCFHVQGSLVGDKLQFVAN